MTKNDIIEDYTRLLKSAINVKLKSDDTSYNNTVGLELTADRLLVWLNEPSESILNVEFKDKLEQIISTLLYPAFVVKHKAGLTLVPRLGQPAESARALGFELHFGLYDRLKVSNLLQDIQIYENNHALAIALMHDYYWIPSKSPHLAIMAVTRAGKTTFLRYLIANCFQFSKIAVRRGALDDHSTSIITIDPKLDADLRKTVLGVGGHYLSPSFERSDNSFIDEVNVKLKEIVDLIRIRAEKRKENLSIKFKDLFLFIDEGIALSAMGSTKAKTAYFGLLDRLLLMGASFSIHVVMASQSFTVGASGALTSQARLEFTTKILLASRLNTENVQFLFKDLDNSAISNLILDEDSYGSLGVGIVTNGDGNIVPFKAPYIEDFGGLL